MSSKCGSLRNGETLWDIFRNVSYKLYLIGHILETVLLLTVAVGYFTNRSVKQRNSAYTIKLSIHVVSVPNFRYRLTLPARCGIKCFGCPMPAGVRSKRKKSYPFFTIFSVNVQTMTTVHVSVTWKQFIVFFDLLSTRQVQSRVRHFFTIHFQTNILKVK